MDVNFGFMYFLTLLIIILSYGSLYITIALVILSILGGWKKTIIKLTNVSSLFALSSLISGSIFSYISQEGIYPDNTIIILIYLIVGPFLTFLFSRLFFKKLERNKQSDKIYLTTIAILAIIFLILRHFGFIGHTGGLYDL